MYLTFFDNFRVVEVANSEAAAKACEDLHQHEVNERKIVVRAVSQVST